MKVVTNQDIKNMNKLYLEMKTYAAVARATGFSPATVKKYIIKEFEDIDESTFIRFEGPLPEFDPKIFRKKDWGDLCVIREDEINELRGLWKEIEI